MATKDPDLEHLIQRYRQLDFQVGQVITTMEVHHELLLHRRLQVELHRFGLEGMLTICLAGVTVIYSLSPDKPFIRIVLAIIAGGYIIRLIQQVFTQRRERNTLKNLVPFDAGSNVEDEPHYIQTVVSGHGTRLSAANEVLQCKFAQGDPRKKKFLVALEYWKQRLYKERQKIQRLQEKGCLSRDDFESINGLIDQALEQQGSAQDGEAKRG